MTAIEIKVPDLGGTENIDVIEVLVKPGDTIEIEQTIAVLETDKATMDLPSSASGKIEQLHIKVGDKVSEGTLIATVSESEGSTSNAAVAESAPASETVTAQEPPAETSAPPAAEAAASPPSNKASTTPPAQQPSVAPPLAGPPSSTHKVHATPSVRLFARELGVDISQITEGGGRKGRILHEDVKQFVKQKMTSAAISGGAGGAIPAIPAVDFKQYGEVEEIPLNKIKKLTGQNMVRVWLNVPMVTYHDDADITDMEAFRKEINADKNNEIKLTPLVFIIKALVTAMQRCPAFNSSLSPDGEKLIIKHYYNIGIAVDTPNGLVVPVLRDCDKKGIYQLSKDLSEMSAAARNGKLKPSDMQGGCMTISSLGGIGGTAFTPIVNAPEVAILGITRAKMQPVWNGESFAPRLMLPLDLSYDHRVIDGAQGARFMETIKSYLSDIRRLVL